MVSVEGIVPHRVAGWKSETACTDPWPLIRRTGLLPYRQQRPGPGEVAVRIAIIDDFQNVALSVADWSPVETKADISVFQDHTTDQDCLVERLRDYEMIMVMRERTPFPRALI